MADRRPRWIGNKDRKTGGKLQSLQGIELIDKDDVVFVIAVHLAVSSLDREMVVALFVQRKRGERDRRVRVRTLSLDMSERTVPREWGPLIGRSFDS